MRAIPVRSIDISKRKCTLARCEKSAIPAGRTTDLARHNSSGEPQSYTAGAVPDQSRAGGKTATIDRNRPRVDGFDSFSRILFMLREIACLLLSGRGFKDVVGELFRAASFSG